MMVKWPVPEPILFQNDIGDLKQLLVKENVKTFGLIDDDILFWPINRQQALEALSFLSSIASPILAGMRTP